MSEGKKVERRERKKALVEVLDIRREGENAVILAQVKKGSAVESLTIIKPWEEVVKMREEDFERLLKQEARIVLKIRKLKEIVVEV